MNASAWRMATTALNPNGFTVLSGRAVERARKLFSPSEERTAHEWCAKSAIDQAAWARSHDAALWAEAEAFAVDLEKSARAALARSPVRFGGGGASSLLYFMVRWRRPETVVETGVAAGWSTSAILAAMERNGSGHLWSSDFPYYKQKGAADAIGFIVDQSLRHRWTLYKDGDVANLSRILAEVRNIDLFHYDSDKSYAGRARALKQVGPKLSREAIVMFDDIQDNRHFQDIAGPDAVVFPEGGKYAGLLRY